MGILIRWAVFFSVKVVNFGRTAVVRVAHLVVCLPLGGGYELR
jgi:hypothetical protein